MAKITGDNMYAIFYVVTTSHKFGYISLGGINHGTVKLINLYTIHKVKDCNKKAKKQELKNIGCRSRDTYSVHLILVLNGSHQIRRFDTNNIME